VERALGGACALQDGGENRITKAAGRSQRDAERSWTGPRGVKAHQTPRRMGLRRHCREPEEGEPAEEAILKSCEQYECCETPGDYHRAGSRPRLTFRAIRSFSTSVIGVASTMALPARYSQFGQGKTSPKRPGKTRPCLATAQHGCDNRMSSSKGDIICQRRRRFGRLVALPKRVSGAAVLGLAPPSHGGAASLSVCKQLE
jgi:hypothetical protein